MHTFTDKSDLLLANQLDDGPGADTIAEELRRKAMLATDTRAPADAAQRQESFLSNIMLPSAADGTGIVTGTVDGAAVSDSVTDVQITEVVIAERPAAPTEAVAVASDVPSDLPEAAPSSTESVVATVAAAAVMKPAAIIVEAPDQPVTVFEPVAAARVVATVPDEALPPESPAPTVDENLAPDRIELSNLSIDEMAAPGTVIGVLSAFDPNPGDTLTLTLSGGRIDLFEIIDGQLVLKPGVVLDFEDEPFHAITVTATDQAGQSTSRIFTISVVDHNEGPQAHGPLPDQSTNEDTPFTAVLPAGAFTDADLGDTLTLSATLADGSPLPAWLGFDPATGTFSGTPANGDVGALSIRVTATDTAGASADQVFGLTIANTNDGPVAALALTGQTATEDAALTAVLPAGAFTDVDLGDTLTLSATLADGSPLPAWLGFDPATGTFSGTPANGDVGALSIRVTATDTAGASADQVFGLTIANTNDGPVAALALAGQAATEDAAFTAVLPAGAFTDADLGDTLTLSATLADGSPLPAWLGFDPATGTFSGTPANGDVGALSIRVTATDTAGASADQVFGLTIANTNDGPVAALALAGQAATEDAAFTAVLPAGAFTDADLGDTLTLSATLADGSPLPAWLGFDPATGTFSGTPANGDVGALSIRVTATDTAGASAAQVFGLTIANTNDGPVAALALTGQTATEDAAFTAVLPSGAFTDADLGDTLTLSATLADGSPLPAWLGFDPATGTFSGTPANGDVGALSIRVTATDTAGASAAQVFGLTIANTNDGPVITSGLAASFAENAAGTVYTVAATDVDVGTTLTYSLSGTDAALFNIDATTGAVTFKASPDFEAPADSSGNNVYDVIVNASDGVTTTSQAVAISVTNVNEGPVITSGAATSVAENGAGVVYTATSTDPEGTARTYSLSGTDASLFNIDATTGAVTFKSAPNFEAPTDGGGNNVYDVVVNASDGVSTASQAVAISVTNVNEAPTALVGAGVAVQSVVSTSEFESGVTGGSFVSVNGPTFDGTAVNSG